MNDKTWTSINLDVVATTGFSAKQIAVGVILEELEEFGDTNPACIGKDQETVLANLLGSPGDSNTRSVVEQILSFLVNLPRKA